MQLGETIATYDVDLALRGEAGKFEVTSPNSEICYVTRRPNRLVAKAEPPASQTYPRAFLIKKIAEPVALDNGTDSDSSALPEESPQSMTRVPFLLENQEDSDKLSSKVDCAATVPGSLEDDDAEVWHIDLFYSEGDAETGQPCAFVYVKGEHTNGTSGTSQKLMSAPCASFNELDAEIRRLHARLDEICLQAKKNFYKAYAAAASA